MTFRFRVEKPRPAGAIQACPRCSRQRARPLSVLLTCRVMAGGMTKRMTRLSHGSSTEPWLPPGRTAAAVASSRSDTFRQIDGCSALI